MSEIELILTKLKIVSEAKEQGVYVCDKEHSKILLDYMQRQETIIKELNDKIEDDKMIIEGNWSCIDNLREDYNLQKNIIKEVRKYIMTTSLDIYNYYKQDYINELITEYNDKLLDILGSDSK